jgi:hypothetical protein
VTARRFALPAECHDAECRRLKWLSPHRNDLLGTVRLAATRPAQGSIDVVA